MLKSKSSDKQDHTIVFDPENSPYKKNVSHGDKVTFENNQSYDIELTDHDNILLFSKGAEIINSNSSAESHVQRSASGGNHTIDLEEHPFGTESMQVTLIVGDSGENPGHA